jgi:hypothetical protein
MSEKLSKQGADEKDLNLTEGLRLPGDSLLEIIQLETSPLLEIIPVEGG